VSIIVCSIFRTDRLFHGLGVLILDIVLGMSAQLQGLKIKSATFGIAENSEGWPSVSGLMEQRDQPNAGRLQNLWSKTT
jgi:hypothetical protein